MFRKSLVFIAFFCLPALAHADYIVRDISVRDSLAGAYDQSVSLASVGKSFDIKISLVSDNSVSPLSAVPHRVSLTLPSGLQYVSHTVESSDCVSGNGFFGAVSSDSSFSFDFTPNSAICESVVRLQYRTAGIGYGVYSPINPVIYDSGVDGIFGTADDNHAIVTLANSITLNIITKNPLLSAKTVDTNGNGYIDAYDLDFWNIISSSFPANTTTFSYGLLSAVGSNFTYQAGSSSGRLAFSDNIYGTDAVPTITIPSDLAYTNGSYFVGVCQDGAAPAVTPSVAPGTYNWAISVSLSASESGTIRYSTGVSVTAWSPLYTGPISINSNTTLLSLSTDALGNSATKSFVYAFACSASAPANGSISAYPSCSVSCNSGYTLKNGSCSKNASSGGGGGGGGGGGWMVVIAPPTTSTGSAVTSPIQTGSTSPIGNSNWSSGSGGSTENPYVFTVPKVAKDDLLIYRTKSLALSGVLAKWEKKYLFKINAVYLSKSINAARYKETILAWNRFILYASMWKMDRPIETYKTEAISAYEIFYKVYRRPVLPTSTKTTVSSSTPTTSTTVSSSLGQSIYSKQARNMVSGGLSLVFTKDYAVGAKNADILRLQKILIAFGYLKISAPTDYFGPATTSALSAFQKEVLEMSSSTGKLDSITRARIRELSGE